MAKKKEQITIREYISQKDIDELMESAFVEQAEAADELELELSDLAETTAFDASGGEDPGFISNDDIGALFKTAGAKRESRSTVSDDDVGSLVSQSDIDALLSGGMDAVTPSKSARDEQNDDIGGLISQGDIDALLKAAMTAAPADQAPDSVAGGGIVSQSDLDALLSGEESGSEDASDSGLISQYDIDALLGGPSKKASEAEDTFEPQERNEDGNVISQSDIDALLKGAMASEEADTREDGDNNEGIVSQSDIDSLLGGSPASESLEEKELEPEPVILAEGLPEAAVFIPDAPVLSRRWYTRRLYRIGAMVALLFIISSSVFFYASRSREPAPKPVVLRFAIQKPESKAATQRVAGNTSVTMPGFLVLAPSDNRDITCLTADLQLDFSDSSMVRIIKDNEGFVRNIIYGVINEAMLSSPQRAIEKTTLAQAVREAIGRVVPREMIRGVSFGKFEII
ncbi:MAG: hypothetical protein V2B19_29620 [Pseudomonadota bacterium]